MAALALLSVCVVLITAAYISTVRPGSVGLAIGSCEGRSCVSSVTPGGAAWFYEIKPGTEVVSVNGRNVAGNYTGTVSEQPLRQVEVLTSTGRTIRVELTRSQLAESPMKFSLWALSGMFALLGAAVVIRRPDLATARMFYLFAGSVAVALAVGPSAAGPAPAWARILQALSLLGIGSTFLPFVSSLTREPTETRRGHTVSIVISIGLVLTLCYVVSLVVWAPLYRVVRPAVLVYVSASAVGGVALLAMASIGQRPSVRRQQARLCLWGTALGMLPIAGLGLLPKALAHTSLLPDHVTILGLVFMPVAFAYAILQHQMLGIRRLVHRGMVYGMASAALLTLITVALKVAVPPSQRAVEGDYGAIVLGAFLVAGIVLFFPLRRGIRWLVDTLIYGDAINSRSFWSILDHKLLSGDEIHGVAKSIAERFVQLFHLESALVFLGSDASGTRLTARAGDRAGEVLERLHPQLEPQIVASTTRDSAELRWESDSFVLLNLKSADRYLGYMLLGPKRAGEVFLEEEKRLAASLAPVVALAIDKNELSEELRELNRRLIRTQEAERARIAGNIHDGPLQKAIMLVGAFDRGGNPVDTARELVLELREVCSRLRPAILDDLGVVPALDWLLEGVSKQSGVETTLSLHNVGEEERFRPDVELALFRVAQEASNNAVKHSKGTRVSVSLSRNDEWVILQVEDNGAGFSPSESQREGFGLAGMRERLMHLQGSLDIRSLPGVGTSLTARIPLTQVKNGRGR